MKSDKVLYYELFVNYIISSTSKYKRLKISRWNYYANYKYIYLKLSYSTLKNTNLNSYWKTRNVPYLILFTIHSNITSTKIASLGHDLLSNPLISRCVEIRQWSVFVVYMVISSTNFWPFIFRCTTNVIHEELIVQKPC